ncbi:glycosyltransferase N-terminal domain-containing protein [uncultured Porphyromonas sp.]|uniref:3-deoxy-D-manno-octulosonic acid transferase n=1 Tax=uncultured Porphyromonas sp. TaxID=159274 RepID=UPI002601F5CB|nr:glycosyltransferase N-terminal domain-containing protein [uncultured Porphyromonas sp.]
MKNPLYSFAGILASAGLHLAARFSPKARLIIEGRKDTPLRLGRLDATRPVVWFHASSLGEFEQGRPLMEAVRRTHPEYQILLSFFSPSGYTVRQDYAGADVVVYLPSDRSSSVRRFLDLARPSKAIFIKYDFWPTMLYELRERGIPTYLISAIFRPDQLFFRPWGKWYLRLLTLFERLYVQDEDSRQLLQRHGITAVSVAGDTRFDRVIEIASTARAIPEAAALEGKVLVAGSTWPEDEAILLPYFNRLGKEYKLIIAPHEIHEEHLQAIEAQLTRPSIRYSQLQAGATGDYDCLIIDCFGLLSSIYRYGRYAWVGGGFGKSVHNTLEAAVYGIPVFFGPEVHKHREVRELIQRGLGFVLHSEEDFAALLQRFDDEAACREVAQQLEHFFAEQRGATEQLLSELF